MTEKIPGLMGFVVRELKADSETSSSELYQKAQRRYPAVADMTIRQFHARYPLQAKRQMNERTVRRFPVPKATEVSAGAPVESGGSPAGGEAEAAATGISAASDRAAASATPEDPTPPAKPKPDPRPALRTLLYRLALDLETAPSRAELVGVIARMDRYVDEAIEIARDAAS